MGLETLYQTRRSERWAARLAAAARRTISRSSGSSITDDTDSATADSSGPGTAAATGAVRGSSPGAGSGPTAKRNAGGHAASDPSAAVSCFRSSGSSSASSFAQAADSTATCSVPSRPIRSGHADRAIAGPTACGPGPRHRCERRRVGDADPPQRTTHVVADPLHQPPSPCRRTPRGAAPAQAAAPRRRSPSRSPARRRRRAR